MSWDYAYFLARIGTGMLLVPVSGAAVLLLERFRTTSGPTRVVQRTYTATLWLLLGLAMFQGVGWLLHLKGVSYDTALASGWRILIVMAAHALTPMSALAVIVHNRPGRIRRMVFGVTLALCLIQAPYWLLFGFWAVIFFLSEMLEML